MASKRIDLSEFKFSIEAKIGEERANKYFTLVGQFLSFKLKKSVFDKLCVQLIGKANIPLHNRLIKSITDNACTATAPPPLKVNKKIQKVSPRRGPSSSNAFISSPRGGHPSSTANAQGGLSCSTANAQGGLSCSTANAFISSPRRGLSSSITNAFISSPRKGRTPMSRDLSKFRDRLSPLGPLGKPQSITRDESGSITHDIEAFSVGNNPRVVSVEDGEEVEQAAVGSPSIQSKSHAITSPLPAITAPFGVSFHSGDRASRSTSAICQDQGELPDTISLKICLEQRLKKEGIEVSIDAANSLNKALDLYLKRLIEPCLALTESRKSRTRNASMLDFRTAMELNPQLLGHDYPIQMTKTQFSAWKD